MFDLLIDYIRRGRIRIDRSRFPQLAAYHDPCNYGRKAQMRFGHGFFEEPRYVIKSVCNHFHEMAEDTIRWSRLTGEDAIVVYNMQGGTTYLSPSFTEVFGWTLEEVEGQLKGAGLRISR